MERVATPASGLAVPAAVAWPLVLVGLTGLLWGAFEVGRGNAAKSEITSSGPRIEDVRKIAKLAVLRVQVANVIEGQTAGARAAVLVKGDADIAVDLDQVEIVSCDEQAKSATLLIPPPHPDRPRVDHARTRIYQLEKTGLAAINPFADPRPELLADAMRAAQAEVERAVSDEEFVVRAKEQTELLLKAFYGGLGWNVTVQWK